MNTNVTLAELAVQKVKRRLIPFLFVLYIAAWLDRVNVGFAALQMNIDLNFSAEAFGLGSGVFFIGYCLFEVPSNFILHRVGARVWIARIMISWGLIASAMMFVRSPTSFYVLRFLLGAAEAGFFPGVIYYLNQWFPAADRARATAGFMLAIPVAGLLGGPISGLLLGLDGAYGLSGWQWLFLLEGVPSILLGICVVFYLTNRPEEAHWLAAPERSALVARLNDERRVLSDAHGIGASGTLKNPTVWHLGTIFFLANLGFYAYSIWSPQIIKSFVGTNNLMVGMISGLISVVVIVVMLLNSAHSDRSGERPLHVAIPMFVMAGGFLMAAALGSTPTAIAFLALAPIAMGAAYGPFWSMPGSFLSGKAAAAGIAMVATIVNLSGFLGPTLIGLLKGQSGTYSTGLWVLGIASFAAALLTLALRRNGALVACRSERELQLVRPDSDL
jgi:MFS transporter, ACS family, tartrate transporter